MPDYIAMAQKENAVSLFNSYLRLFDIMIELEPDLFRTALKTLKKKKDFQFDMEQVKKFRRLYPELVPNVFLRLWKQDYEPKELERRNELV